MNTKVSKNSPALTHVSQGRQKKEVVIAKVTDKMHKAKGLVFTNYQGLTHQQLESLKRTLKKMNAEFMVVKNTLLLRSLSDKKLSDDNKTHFQNPTGTLFMYEDIIDPLKQLAKTIKELNLPTIKFGLLEGKSVTDKDVIKLSTLPPLPVLRAQLLGQMQGPIQGLHRALSWNMQKFVMTLQAISDKKQAH